MIVCSVSLSAAWSYRTRVSVQGLKSALDETAIPANMKLWTDASDDPFLKVSITGWMEIARMRGRCSGWTYLNAFVEICSVLLAHLHNHEVRVLLQHRHVDS